MWDLGTTEMFPRIPVECQARDQLNRKMGMMWVPNLQGVSPASYCHTVLLSLTFLSSQYNQTSGRLYNTHKHDTLSRGTTTDTSCTHQCWRKKHITIIVWGMDLYAVYCDRPQDPATWVQAHGWCSIQLTIQLLAYTKPFLGLGIIT